MSSSNLYSSGTPAARSRSPSGTATRVNFRCWNGRAIAPDIVVGTAAPAPPARARRRRSRTRTSATRWTFRSSSRSRSLGDVVGLVAASARPRFATPRGLAVAVAVAVAFPERVATMVVRRRRAPARARVRTTAEGRIVASRRVTRGCGTAAGRDPRARARVVWA